MAMKTTFGVVGLVLWACLGIAAAQQPTPPSPSAPAPAPQVPPQPQFETRAEVVLVDVTVVSGNGDPVTGLDSGRLCSGSQWSGAQRAHRSVHFVARDEDRRRGATTGRRQQQRWTVQRAAAAVRRGRELPAGSAAPRAVLRTAERVMESASCGRHGRIGTSANWTRRRRVHDRPRAAFAGRCRHHGRAAFAFD